MVVVNQSTVKFLALPKPCAIATALAAKPSAFHTLIAVVATFASCANVAPMVLPITPTTVLNVKITAATPLAMIPTP